MNSHRNQKGFTLIELLIAITILALIITTATFSYNLVSSRWNKELGDFSVKALHAKHAETLFNVTRGIKSFVVRNSEQKPVFYFVGKEDSLLAVTASGVFTPDTEIFRITSVKKDNGKFDIVYQAQAAKKAPIVSTSQTINFDRSLVLFADVDEFMFEYFGWDHLYDKTDDSGQKSASWRTTYSGLLSQYMPNKVKVSIRQEKKILSFTVNLQSDTENWISPYIEKDS